VDAAVAAAAAREHGRGQVGGQHGAEGELVVARLELAIKCCEMDADVEQAPVGIGVVVHRLCSLVLAAARRMSGRPVHMRFLLREYVL